MGQRRAPCERCGAGVALTAERDTRRVLDLPVGATLAELAPARASTLLADRDHRYRAMDVAAAMARAAARRCGDRGAGRDRPVTHAPGPGTVLGLFTAPATATAIDAHDDVEVVAGRGVVGDRYFTGTGTYWRAGKDGQDLTLIEQEALDALRAQGLELDGARARRNVVTRDIDLNALVGARFSVGAVECVGRRLCDPCAHLERLTAPGVLRGLVGRGGLRADVVRGGTVRVGDPVTRLGG